MATTRHCSRWLGLAASPSFAIMAALTASDRAGLCLSAPGPWPMDGMTGMYVLMTIFHLPPWLRLIARPAGPPRFSN